MKKDPTVSKIEALGNAITIITFVSVALLIISIIINL